MKKILAIAAMLMLAGCQKLIDKIYHHDPVAKICKLQSIRTIGEFDNFYQRFYYNKWGEPDSIVYDEPGTGSPSLYFTYDKIGRLIKHTNGDIGEYRYVYEPGSLLPVRDTILDYYTNIFVQTYTYDDKGRIVKVFVDWLGSDFPEFSYDDREITYVYNEQGNLYSGDGIIYSGYDDKVNLLRTSKVLQFIHRNYSLNNRAVATQYNEHGLPVLYDYSSSPETAPYLRQEIEYVCK